MTNFVLIGAAGYVAPKHIKAIKDNGGNLIAAHDVHDSVGILDSYFRDCYFTPSKPAFETWVYDHKDEIDYFVVCTPNYMHYRHCLMGLLKAEANVICEKPVVLNLHDIELLQDTCNRTGRTISPILQLRYGLVPQPFEPGKKPALYVRYYTPRGQWYHESWKGNRMKSGGLMTNIGIHLFDWLFLYYGKVQSCEFELYTNETCSGWLNLEKADVEFHISICKYMQPSRRIRIYPEGRFGDEFEDYSLAGNFNDLHSHSYAKILEGNGFTLEDCIPSIEFVEKFREFERTIR